jgi:hypothetical protein
MLDFFQVPPGSGIKGTATKIMLRMKNLAGFEGFLFVHARNQVIQTIEESFRSLFAHDYTTYKDLSKVERDTVKECIAQKLFEHAKNERTTVLIDSQQCDAKEYSDICHSKYKGEMGPGQVYFPDIYSRSIDAGTTILPLMQEALQANNISTEKKTTHVTPALRKGSSGGDPG